MFIYANILFSKYLRLYVYHYRRKRQSFFIHKNTSSFQSARFHWNERRQSGSGPPSIPTFACIHVNIQTIPLCMRVCVKIPLHRGIPLHRSTAATPLLCLSYEEVSPLSHTCSNHSFVIRVCMRNKTPLHRATAAKPLSWRKKLPAFTPLKW